MSRRFTSLALTFLLASMAIAQSQPPDYWFPAGAPAGLVQAPLAPGIQQTAYAPATTEPGVWDARASASTLERLNEAEATIAELRTQIEHQRRAAGTSSLTNSNAGIPAFPDSGRYVADEGEHESEPFGIFGLLGQRWRNLGDPEFELINYHTRSASVGGPAAKAWYERYSLRGYTQFRINESIWESAESAPPHHVGDRSVSPNQNFLIRRARLVLAGDVSERMYIYFQPDFAVTPPGSPDATHFVQLRDWYTDLYIDTDKVYRIRLGQSKVPYGWENLQSSSNRVPLDRNDGFNSAARNERDLGVFFYWTPEFAQDFFKEVLAEGLKGSGNYGVFGIGAYNGQGGSLVEQNDNMHVVARLTWPFTLPNHQHVEIGAQAYTGKYTVLSSPISPLGVGEARRPAGTREEGNVAGIRDDRVGGTFVWYPQPLGFQAEWNAGRGPSLNDAQDEVIDRALTGGYAMALYRLQGPRGGELFPFVRWAYYQGGYKPERNAPYSQIDEWELGCEWQINPQMEFTGVYTITDRTNTTAISQADVESYRQYEGHILRFQFQINY